MRASPIIAAAALLLQPIAPASAQPPAPPGQSHLLEGGHAVAVVRGERVEVTVAADGALTIARATVVGEETVAIATPTAGGALPPSVRNATKNTAPQGEIVLTLGGSAATGSILKFENGLDRHVGYRAGIVSMIGGKLDSRGTSVCSVPAHVVSVEQWSQPVIRVVVGDVADRAGAAPSCG